MNQSKDTSRIIIIETGNDLQQNHDFAAFYVEGKSKAFYIGANKNIKVPGKKVVDAHSFFIGKILREAVCDLNMFLDGHQSATDLFSTELFWKDALQYAGRTIMPHTLWIDYRTIPNGYFIVHSVKCEKILRYNFVNDTYYLPGDGTHNDYTIMPFELCYDGLLDQLLAQRFAQTGYIPGAYTEIAGINGFLKGKPSVQFKFSDGSCYQSLQFDHLNAGKLFKLEDGRLMVNNVSFLESSSVVGHGLPVAILYCDTQFEINTQALETLNLSEKPAVPAMSEADQHAERNAHNLMPPSVIAKFKKSRLYSKDGQGKKAEVVVKYFNPCGAGTWLITEGRKEKNGDWLLFGMCHIFEWEWGYVMLSELQALELPFGMKIERDLYSSGTVGELMGGYDDDAA